MITTTTLDPNLSASALSIFGACQRLFEFRYVRPRAWPGPTSPDLERDERVLRAGQQLHQLVHMHARGLDASGLAATTPEAARWYRAYMGSPFAAPAGEVWSEQALMFSQGGRKVVAKVDRIIRTDDRWTVIDWKTSRRAPSAEQLQQDWQALLYPLALVEAGTGLNGGKPIRPSQVETVFYYLDPDTARTLPFDDHARRRSVDALQGAIEAIAQAEREGFAPTGMQTGRCEKPLCPYFSLCHMQPPPAVTPGGEDDEAAAPERLALFAEFEFDDEPVVL